MNTKNNSPEQHLHPNLQMKKNMLGKMNASKGILHFYNISFLKFQK